MSGRELAGSLRELGDFGEAETDSVPALVQVDRCRRWSRLRGGRSHGCTVASDNWATLPCARRRLEGLGGYVLIESLR